MRLQMFSEAKKDEAVRAVWSDVSDDPLDDGASAQRNERLGGGESRLDKAGAAPGHRDDNLQRTHRMRRLSFMKRAGQDKAEMLEC